jgi:hypothetical protein
VPTTLGAERSPKLYCVLISMHGLVRGEAMELGKDPDTGGQVRRRAAAWCAVVGGWPAGAGGTQRACALGDSPHAHMPTCTRPQRHHATPRHATPRHATPRHATPRHATPRHATPRHATPRHAANTHAHAARSSTSSSWPRRCRATQPCTAWTC